MATSTVKMQGAIINGVRVAPGTNHNSYELGFGYTAYHNRLDTAKNISTATYTEIVKVELGSNYGKYIVLAAQYGQLLIKLMGLDEHRYSILVLEVTVLQKQERLLHRIFVLHREIWLLTI